MSNCVFDNEDKCRALNEKDCIGCSFYKTKEQLIEGREKAEMRVSQLEPELRQHFIHKYYGGRSIFKG